MTARPPTWTRAHVGVATLALLLLALPLLVGALALGTGGLPHEGLDAANTRDVSTAALDRMERYLSGDLSVGLGALPVAMAVVPPARDTCAADDATVEASNAFPAPARVQRRF